MTFHASMLAVRHTVPAITPASGRTVQRRCACSDAADPAPCKRCAQPFQAKLAIADNDDPLEREADRVADQVLGAAPGSARTTGVGASVQRRAAPDHLPTPDSAPASIGRVLAEPGARMVPALLDEMQTRFGQDFSRVRVHTDAAASRSAGEIEAEAYTVGDHVVFAQGRYAPASPAGRHLIAHELTHVLQQRGGSGTVARKPTASAPAIGSRFTPPAGTSSALKGVHADFDGQDFSVSDSTAVRLTHAAQSGRPVSVRAKDAAACGGSTADSYINNPLYVGIQDFGAIPEGEYSFDLSKFAVFDTAEQLQMITGGMFTDPFGAALHGGDWGAGRAALAPKRLLPAPKSGCGDTGKRSGFYLHGGSLPGSSGCIDIDNSGIAAVLGLLGGHKAPVPVKVRYTRPAPSTGSATRGLGRFTYPTKDGKPIKDPSLLDRLGAVLGDDDAPVAPQPEPKPEPPATKKTAPPPAPEKKKKKKPKSSRRDDVAPGATGLAADSGRSDGLDDGDEDDDERLALGPVQAKRTVGATDDPLEREADHLAEAVVAGSARPSAAGLAPSVRPFRAVGASVAPSSVDTVVSAPGAPLAPDLAQDMGRRFGRDFSHVRVHTDAAAAASARQIGALAYTAGANVVFAAGRFAPQTQAGRRLIAHELTHVLQQGAGGLPGGGVVQRDGDDPPRSISESFDPSTHTYDQLVAEAGRLQRWLAANPADSVQRTELQNKLAAVVQTANRLGQKRGLAPLAFIDPRPVSKPPEQIAALDALNKLSNPASTSPFLEPPKPAARPPQKPVATAALPPYATWLPLFMDGLSSSLGTDAKLQAGWQVLKAQLAAPNGTLRFAGGTAAGIVPGAVVAVADIPYSVFKAYVEFGMQSQFGHPTKEQLDQAVASVVAGFKKLVVRLPELLADVATQPREMGAWAAAMISEKIRNDLFLEAAEASEKKPAAASPGSNPIDFSDVKLPDLYGSAQTLLSIGAAAGRGKDVLNKGIACGMALGYALANIAMLFIGPEELAAKAGSLGAKGIEGLKASGLGRRLAGLAEAIPEFKGMVAARKAAAEAQAAKSAVREGEALAGAAKGVEANASLAEARAGAAELIERHPERVQGTPGSRHADVGGGHQIVEVPDPNVPSGIGCEIHSPPPFVKVPCPAPLGRIQNVPSTKREADAAAVKLRTEWEARGNQPKRFVESPHLHHLFPEDARLQTHWDRLGIDNQDARFKVWLNPDVHLKDVHGGHSDPGGLWNAGWLEYFDKHPNASKAEVIDHLAVMRKSFGI